jgi:hypothetical protein
MKKYLVITSLFFYIVNGTAQSFDIKKGTILSYATTEDEDSINLKVTIMEYGKKAIFSFTNWEGKAPYGKIIITEKNMQKALHPSIAPSYIYERRDAVAQEDSGFWLSKEVYKKLVSTNQYILKDRTREDGIKFTAKPIKYLLNYDGNRAMNVVDAYALVSDTLTIGNSLGILKLTILKNENNPLLLESSSVLIHTDEGNKEEITYSMQLRIVKK